MFGACEGPMDVSSGAWISGKLQLRSKENCCLKIWQSMWTHIWPILSAKHILFQVIVMAFREAVCISTPEEKMRIASRFIVGSLSCDQIAFLIWDGFWLYPTVIIATYVEKYVTSLPDSTHDVNSRCIMDINKNVMVLEHTVGEYFLQLWDDGALSNKAGISEAIIK